MYIYTYIQIYINQNKRKINCFFNFLVYFKNIKKEKRKIYLENKEKRNKPKDTKKKNGESYAINNKLESQKQIKMKCLRKHQFNLTEKDKCKQYKNLL